MNFSQKYKLYKEIKVKPLKNLTHTRHHDSDTFETETANNIKVLSERQKPGYYGNKKNYYFLTVTYNKSEFTRNFGFFAHIVYSLLKKKHSLTYGKIR